ncbi:hypothetical protein AC578_10572 [Pseudocercospora eumusae]|uniref:Uncharacterized protein n=1 Tax=Pseudocercospora eumusae TaxID=321146 RepID=A0A139H5H3_9PEZI|nr:hypothetical protein AC578_10572 [Pseudocercospora eumusae]
MELGYELFREREEEQNEQDKEEVVDQVGPRPVAPRHGFCGQVINGLADIMHGLLGFTTESVPLLALLAHKEDGEEKVESAPKLSAIKL